MALELAHRGHFERASPHLVHEAGVDAAGEEDVGELVVADVELDRVEVAGVVDVAALRDGETALSDDQLLVSAPGAIEVLSLTWVISADFR